MWTTAGLDALEQPVLARRATPRHARQVALRRERVVHGRHRDRARALVPREGGAWCSVV